MPKKSAKKPAPRSKSTKTSRASAPASPAKPILPVDLKTAKPPKLSNKHLVTLLIIILSALLVYKIGPWLFPAVVDGKPISRFTVYSRMEKAYGAQTMDDMINERILDNAIEASGVEIDQSRLDAEIAKIEEQFKDIGGLDDALSQRGITRKELEKQIRTQLSVEEILKDKIAPTEEEISKEFESNALTLYKDKALIDVREDIITTLEQSKLRDAFLEWFAGVKESANVKTFSTL